MATSRKEKQVIYRNGLYVQTFNDESYTTKYWIIIIDDMKELVTPYKELTGRKYHCEGEAAFVEDWVDSAGQFNVVICFERKTTHAIVAHECNHALNRTFKHHGMKLDVKNDEHQCYYLGYLVNKCYVAFEKEIELRQKAEAKTKLRSAKRR